MRWQAMALVALVGIAVLAAAATETKTFTASVSKPVFALRPASGQQPAVQIPVVVRGQQGRLAAEPIPALTEEQASFILPESRENTPVHYYHCTDVWNDGTTEIRDLAFFAQHYNACSGDGTGRYDERADFDSDGCTDAVDFAIFRHYFIAGTPTGQNPYCTQESGPYNCPDLSNDGNVNIIDLALYVRTNNKCLGDDGFNGEADFNADGCVDGIDFAIFKKAFQNPEWQYYCEQPA